MSARHLEMVAMDHGHAVTALLDKGLRPKLIPYLVPSMDHRTVRRLAKLSGIVPRAGREIENTRHHLREPAYSFLGSMAIGLFVKNKVREQGIDAHTFVSIVNTLEAQNTVSKLPTSIAVFTLMLMRDFCNGAVYLKVCTDCGFKYPTHKMSIVHCGACAGHSRRSRRRRPEPPQDLVLANAPLHLLHQTQGVLALEQRAA